MNVFLATPFARRVEPATPQGSGSGQGALQQDRRRQREPSEDFAAVLARLVKPA